MLQSVRLSRLDVCNVPVVDYPAQSLSRALLTSRLTVLHLHNAQLSGMPLYTLGTVYKHTHARTHACTHAHTKIVCLLDHFRVWTVSINLCLHAFVCVCLHACVRVCVRVCVCVLWPAGPDFDL